MNAEHKCSCGRRFSVATEGDAVAKVDELPRDTVNISGVEYPAEKDGKPLRRFDKGQPVYE